MSDYEAARRLGFETTKQQLNAMFNRLAARGQNAIKVATALLSSDLSLGEIEVAAEAISAKAREAHDYRLYAKGEAAGKRLLGK
jgi:hypothetical protein